MRRFEADSAAQAELANTRRLAELDASDFDAVFYPGGHGPLWDLSADPVSISLIEGFIADGKPVAAVCHALAVLVNAKSGPSWRTALTALARTKTTKSRPHPARKQVACDMSHSRVSTHHSLAVGYGRGEMLGAAPAGCPGPLKVVTAKPAGDVQRFADRIQARHLLYLEGFR